MKKSDKYIDVCLKRYLSFYEARKLSDKALVYIEQVLGVILPHDFKKISKVFDGFEILGGIDLFSFDPESPGFNIVGKTLFYRSSDMRLPSRFIALRESEVSFVVMETQADEKIDAPIFECSISDAYNISEGKPMLDNPVFYPSFADFFSYLLDLEESEREDN